MLGGMWVFTCQHKQCGNRHWGLITKKLLTIARTGTVHSQRTNQHLLFFSHDSSSAPWAVQALSTWAVQALSTLLQAWYKSNDHRVIKWISFDEMMIIWFISIRHATTVVPRPNGMCVRVFCYCYSKCYDFNQVEHWDLEESPGGTNNVLFVKFIFKYFHLNFDRRWRRSGSKKLLLQWKRRRLCVL